MSSGDKIHVTDGNGNLVHAKILIRGKRVEIEILEVFPQKQAEKDSLHIAIALTKTMDRFEFFVEKAVELGVSEITPLLCTNSERKNIKIEKIHKKIESTCKQSLRILFPVINPLTSIKELMLKEENTLWVAHCYKEYEKKPIKRIFTQKGKTTILVGPEGDFSKKEIEELYSLGAVGIELGYNRLRTETAGIFVAASYYFSKLQD